MADNLMRYIDDFFAMLRMYEDEERGHSFKAYIHQSIVKFLENENKETAFDVYLSFLTPTRFRWARNPTPSSTCWT